ERYKFHRFPAEIISHGVWLYYRISIPRTLRQAAAMLAEDTGEAVTACETFLTQLLLLAYATRSPSTGRGLLAFRLHQFIAGAGDLYGTLEPPGIRDLTVIALEGRSARSC